MIFWAMCSFWSLSANGGEKIESLSFCVIYIRNTCIIVHWRKNNDGCHSAFCCCKRVHRFSTKDRFPARAWSHLLSFWNLVCKYILNFMSMSKYTITCTLDYNYFFFFNHNMFYLMFCSLYNQGNMGHQFMFQWTSVDYESAYPCSVKWSELL